MIATKEDPHPAGRGGKKGRGLGCFGASLCLGLGFLALNFLVQVCRKPSELLRFARLDRARTPQETWSEYGDDFTRYATDVVTPDLLAALVQVESSGDSMASPAWTWRWSLSPWSLYGPPSSAVGILQMTNGNFGSARGLCVKDGRVARQGAWYDPDACTLTVLHSRLNASHSIEMTSAFLHTSVQKVLAGARGRASLRDKQELAAVIHLCGPNKGPAFLRARFDAGALGSCGSQSVGSYVRLVMRYRAEFSRLAAGGIFVR